MEPVRACVCVCVSLCVCLCVSACSTDPAHVFQASAEVRLEPGVKPREEVGSLSEHIEDVENMEYHIHV